MAVMGPAWVPTALGDDVTWGHRATRFQEGSCKAMSPPDPSRPGRNTWAISSQPGASSGGLARSLGAALVLALTLFAVPFAGADDRPVAEVATRSLGAAEGSLRVSGPFFVDPAGGVVLLRGVNLTGNAKVPPFDHGVGPLELDRVRDLGMNVIRLLFLWEAYEPIPGVYNDSYLASIQAIAASAWDRGLYTLVDFHQDGFARFASRGSGDGFPDWAVSGRRSVPDNGPHARYWPFLMATDPSTYRSFHDFYHDTHGVRTRYLVMLGRVASALATTPGVIGYDPINEPWGHERREIGPLYVDAARVIRAGHPAAILFLEGQITTNTGLQTRLERPPFENFAYSPHYYKPATIALQRWGGGTRAINHAFVAMGAKAREWNCPLLVSEYGAGATVTNGGDYVAALNDRLDALLASAAQWNYTPLWNERDKDGWNDEDFNILDPSGPLRANFRLRPFPRRIAGIPIRFTTLPPTAEACPTRPSFDFAWHHRPELGDTELFVPRSLFPSGGVTVLASPGVTWIHDPGRQILLCRARTPGAYCIRVSGRD